MRIVHFSDWHGKSTALPEADVYVCSGDMHRNWPEVDAGRTAYRINPKRERGCQMQWGSNSENQLRQYLGSPDAPVICVRGNHDFISIAPLFEGCDVTELASNEVHEILGKTFTGHRGIPYICGTWNDETHRPDLHDLMCRMPRADVYVTHYAPGGVLDGDGFREHYGLDGMCDRLIWLTDPDYSGEESVPVKALHLFGHIHECGGQTVQHGNVLFSNAATTFNVIEF